MPESSSQKIARLQKENTDLLAQITKLNDTIEQLREQLKQALAGDQEQRKLLKDLQEKLDVLIVQSKKRNKLPPGLL